MQRHYVIGLDVGTTGTKAVVADECGTVYGKGYKEYDLIFGENGAVTQSPDDWFDAACYAIRTAVSESNIDPRKIEAISLSTQGASMLAVGRNFEPLCDAITWMDKSTGAEVSELCAGIGEERLYRKSGWPLGCANDAPKILWLRKNRPDIFNSVGSFVSTLEYMNFRMTGNNVTDPSNAAIRSLMNIGEGKYDSEILDFIGIGEDKLPKLQRAGSYVGKLTAEAASLFGLTQEVSVINGAHDQYCASIGSGAVSAGDMLVATGTAWVLLGISDRLIYTPSRACPGIHPADGLYGVMASLVSAGSALKWFRGICSTDYAELDRGAATHRESARNLFFGPYLSGGAFPHGNTVPKAEISGLELSHDKYDIALALMEGVGFEVKTALAEYERFGCTAGKLMMTGRTAHSDVWRGIVRDITGCEILVTDEADTCCVGAAIIAAVGAGIYPSFAQAADAMVKISEHDIPVRENTEFYNEKYKRYTEKFPV